METFIRELDDLAKDEDFIHLGNFYSRANTFRVCGMSHMELWHSRFMAWLLTPDESHHLDMYPLQCYLEALNKAQNKPGEHRLLEAIGLLKDLENWDAQIFSEKSISDKNRLDIYAKYTHPAGKQIVLTVEHKVKDEIKAAQFSKYVEWVQADEPDGLLLFVGAVPTSEIKSSSQATFDSDLWFALDYQTVLDEVLYPCLQHPRLDSYAKQTIHEYITALGSINTKKNAKLVMTQEEAELVNRLESKHRLTFNQIEEIYLNKRKKEPALWEHTFTIISHYYREFETIRELLNTKWNFNNAKINRNDEYRIQFHDRHGKVHEIHAPKLHDIIRQTIIQADDLGVDLEKFIGWKSSERAHKPFFHNQSVEIMGQVQSVYIGVRSYYFDGTKSGKQGMADLSALLDAMGFSNISYELIPKRQMRDDDSIR